MDVQQPVFSHAEPVLPVQDLLATLQYWQDVLAFPNKWSWGEPPNHGGVSWHNAFIQFSQNPERAKASAGNTVWIRVSYIDSLYAMHLERKAIIDEPLQAMPWGLDEYVVKEINGYYVCFSGHSSKREKSAAGLPEEVRIVERNPTIDEFLSLAQSVGWMEFINVAHMPEHLSAAAFSVVAVNARNETIGCALVLSDASSFYYIKDVMVRPDWQAKRVGTALMKAVSDWLDNNAVNKSLVGLYTGENLEPFYQQFGFGKAFGMVKRMKK